MENNNQIGVCLKETNIAYQHNVWAPKHSTPYKERTTFNQEIGIFCFACEASHIDYITRHVFQSKQT
jgi:hypothetical protein